MLERYSRQILFQPIGEEGQLKIMNKHALILGCGALGSGNAENLVRAGIGRVTLIDRDYVEESNLQRQQLYTEEDVEEQTPKAIAAKRRLEAINSNVSIYAYVMDATANTLPTLLSDVDIVIDATDNFDTRFLLNDVCQKYHVPWIFGSCVGSTGMSYTIMPDDNPCLQCLLDAIPVTGATCDTVGIISPAVQMVVAHQTTEALKLLIEDKMARRTSLVTFDLWHQHYQMIHVERAKKEDCPTCGKNPSYPFLQYDNQPKSDVLCGRNTVQIRMQKEVNLSELANRLKNIAPIKVNEFLVSITYESYRLVFFKDGRTLIHGTDSIEKAKSIYYQLVG